jgi:hypothetical protein
MRKLPGDYVVLDGSGALVTETARQLRRAGVDVRTGALVADAAESAVGDGADAPRLVVLVRADALPPWAGAPWQRRAIPHLPVVELLESIVVGPLVLPGRSACVTCLGRAWPGWAAVRPRPSPGVARTASGSVSPSGHPEDTAAYVLATAFVIVIVLAVLRGDEDLAGISTEIGPRASTVTHRLWNARPGCRCSSVTMSA